MILYHQPLWHIQIAPCNFIFNRSLLSNSLISLQQGHSMSDKLPENKLTIRNSTAEFLIFTQQAGESGIEVRYE